MLVHLEDKLVLHPPLFLMSPDLVSVLLREVLEVAIIALSQDTFSIPLLLLFLLMLRPDLL